jgi:hypothetical protein
MTHFQAGIEIPSATMTNAEAALAIARALGPVVPLCYASNGACACSGRYDRDLGHLVPHEGHDIAKAPISKLVRNGLLDATRNSATIDRHWRQEPSAGVGLDLEAAGVIFIDPDSPEALAEALANGVDGGMRRDSRNVGWLFKRPADCPVISITKSADGTDLEIRTTGYAVVWGTHANGAPVRVDLGQQLQDAPAWAVERLKAKAAEKKAQEAATAARREERARMYGDAGEPPVRLHQRGIRRWTGELVELKAGKVDRDLSLWYIGLDLAECGASEEAIVAALEDRDAALGWDKFTKRKDDREYVKIAEKAVARAIEIEKAPRTQFPAPATPGDDVATLKAQLEAAEAEIFRLRRRALDQDDRLEVLEPIVTAIDEVLARPEVETDAAGNVIAGGLTSDDKVVAIGLARYMPHYRNKKQANGERPTIALGYLSKVIGMPKRRISKSLDRLSGLAEDGAAFCKVVGRKPLVDDAGHPVIDDRGDQVWESSLEVWSWGETPAATLRAAATYATPIKPKHGGSQAAAAARWGRCDKHDNREVRIKGYCPDCGKVVGEKIVRLAEFNALNVQVGHSEAPEATVSSVNPIDVQVGHSDCAHEAPERLNVQVVDSALAPTLTVIRPEGQISGPRCGVIKPNGRECVASMYRHLGGGWLRCLGCGNRTRELAAVRGASE